MTPTQPEWIDIVFLILWTWSFAILWRQSARLHNFHFGRRLWRSFSQALVHVSQALPDQRRRIFSAETFGGEEAEILDNRSLRFSETVELLVPWLAGVLLSGIYAAVMWAWIIWNINRG